MTRSRLATNVVEKKAKKKVVDDKQHPVIEPALKPVTDFVELENVKEADDGQTEKETKVNESEKEINKKEGKEKQKEKEKINLEVIRRVQ